MNGTLLAQPARHDGRSAHPVGRPAARAEAHEPPPLPVLPTDLAACSPEELARRAQEGSLPCFAALVERFESRLFNFLLRRMGGVGWAGGGADAEDIVQETFLRAWQKIGTYRPEWRFSTWLFTIAARLAASHTRAARRRPGGKGWGMGGVGWDQDGQRADESVARLSARHGDDPARAACAREERDVMGGSGRRVWDHVAALPSEDQRAAVWLRYVEDMPVKDIARVLGKTPVGVRVMLFRARAVLAERLVEGENDGAGAGEEWGIGVGGPAGQRAGGVS